jgi:hypothetical protein
MNMIINGVKLQTSLKYIFSAVGLLPVARRLRELITPQRPQERERHQRFLRYKRQFRNVLRHNLNGAGHAQKKVLVSGAGYPGVEAELGLIKALELAGYTPVVVIHRRASLDLKYYNLAVKHLLFWEDFASPLELAAAEAIIDQYHSVPELLTFNYEGARVGLIAVSTMRRGLRLGSIDLCSPQQRQVLVKRLALAMRYARAAQSIVRVVHPELALFVDGVYTPEGELIDVCLANGMNAISWNVAHKSNALMLKRYTPCNRECDLASLSEESWQLLRNMQWTDGHREQLEREIYDSYTTGDWYGNCGTQFNKRFLDTTAVNRKLGLDPTKKTAFIFPHILWDASLNRGIDLFRDYEEWFVETVRAACANDRVNWVIKIHPAHVGKSVQEGFYGEPAEVLVLQKHIGELPLHVFFIPADSPISTFSLFAVMDYCLTVRGTVGVEAARLGIPVLTAGTGRYDRKGFTIDSETREEFLEKVAHIQEIPRLSTAQQELAERFAYGLFVLRPLPLTTITLEYYDSKTFIGDYKINIKAKEDWYNAPDLKAFSRWVVESNQSDFLIPFKTGQK